MRATGYPGLLVLKKSAAGRNCPTGGMTGSCKALQTEARAGALLDRLPRPLLMRPRHEVGGSRWVRCERLVSLWLARLVNLLLTSNGLCNPTLRDALRDLLGKPFGSANMAYLDWREFDVLELNGLPQQMVLDRLLHADVVYAGGRLIAGFGHRRFAGLAQSTKDLPAYAR